MKKPTIIVPRFVLILLKIAFIFLPLDWIGLRFEMPTAAPLLLRIIGDFCLMAAVYFIRFIFWYFIFFL